MKKYKTALALSAIPLLITLYTTFLSPRPAGMMQTDLEPDFYYNARLLNETTTTPKISHPGTPIQLLFAGAITLAGDPVARSGAVRIALYLLVGLVNSAALFFFLTRAARGLPFGIQALIVAGVVAWPPFLTHLGYVGSDSFLFATALPAAAFLFAPLAEHRRPTEGEIFLSGLWAGLAIAIKLTALPFVAVLFICVLLLRAKPLVFISSAILAFTAATFPFATAYPFFLKDNIWNQLHHPVTDIAARLRYLSPLILIAPLSVLWSIRTIPHCLSFFRRRVVQGTTAIVALGLMLFSIGYFLVARTGFITQDAAHTALVAERIQHAMPKGGTLAYWFVGSPYAPRSVFHLWGNYLYANNAFDESVLRAFPRETLFQLRTAHELLFPTPQEVKTKDAESFAQKLRAHFMAQNPLPYQKPTNLLFTGEMQGIKPDMVVVPLIGENAWVNDAREKLQNLISARTGAQTLWRTEIIDGIPYAFIGLHYRNPR